MNRFSDQRPPVQQSLGAGRARTGGFTLVSAIFLLVVLVVLGVTVVTLSAVQHSTSAMRIQSLRAHYAARAGLEWAIRRIGATQACNGNLDIGSTAVAVACTQSAHTLDGVARSYYTVTATATSGNWGGTDYVSRQLQAKVLGP